MSPEYFAVHAQGGVPAIGGGPLSARPAAGQPGRLYVSNEGAIYRDSGAAWSALSGDDAASVLAKLLGVDGTGSGLDADTLDGIESTGFALANDARFHTRNHNLFSSDHPDVNVVDVPANAEVLTFNSTTSKWESAPPGALTVPDADETTRGKSENSTTAEVQAGTVDSPYFVSPLKLAAEITRRLTPEAWITPTLLNGWVNFGSGFAGVSFYKDQLGHVHVRGAVSGGGERDRRLCTSGRLQTGSLARLRRFADLVLR